jgi:DNA-binding NarL/FixJ family response regulator
MSRDPSTIRVLTVDDHALLREGIAALVNAESDMKLVGEANNGQEGIEKFRLHQPDVTLIDLQMPALNGIRSEFPNARIIVLTTYSRFCALLKLVHGGTYSRARVQRTPRHHPCRPCRPAANSFGGCRRAG